MAGPVRRKSRARNPQRAEPSPPRVTRQRRVTVKSRINPTALGTAVRRPRTMRVQARSRCQRSKVALVATTGSRQTVSRRGISPAPRRARTPAGERIRRDRSPATTRIARDLKVGRPRAMAFASPLSHVRPLTKARTRRAPPAKVRSQMSRSRPGAAAKAARRARPRPPGACRNRWTGRMPNRGRRAFPRTRSRLARPLRSRREASGRRPTRRARNARSRSRRPQRARPVARSPSRIRRRQSRAHRLQSRPTARRNSRAHRLVQATAAIRRARSPTHSSGRSHRTRKCRRQANQESIRRFRRRRRPSAARQGPRNPASLNRRSLPLRRRLRNRLGRMPRGPMRRRGAEIHAIHPSRMLPTPRRRVARAKGRTTPRLRPRSDERWSGWSSNSARWRMQRTGREATSRAPNG